MKKKLTAFCFILILLGCSQTNILEKYGCTFEEGTLGERYTEKLSFTLRTEDNIIFKEYGEFEIVERIYDTENYTKQYVFRKNDISKEEYATYELLTNKFYFGSDDEYCEIDLNTNKISENCSKFENLVGDNGYLWNYMHSARYFVYDFIVCESEIEYKARETNTLTKEDKEINKLIKVVAEEIKKGNIK